MLYRISVTERGLTGIANIFRSRLSRLDDLLGAGTVPLRVFMYIHGPQRWSLGALVSLSTLAMFLAVASR